MAKKRDPRIDPLPGDVVKPAGFHRLKVLANDGNTVRWRVCRLDREYENSWTLLAWRDHIAYGATVICVAQPEGGNHG